MSSQSEPSDVTLQLTFGIFGVVATFITLAGLHYRDAWGCVLLRRLRRPRDQSCTLHTTREIRSR